MQDVGFGRLGFQGLGCNARRSREEEAPKSGLFTIGLCKVGMWTGFLDGCLVPYAVNLKSSVFGSG